MTAALSWPLQQAMFATLSSNTALATAIGADRVLDGVPHGDGSNAVSPPYVLIGDETLSAWSDKSSRGARHEVSFRIVSAAAGYGQAKAAAAAISDALLGSTPSLTRGRIVRIDFLSATARRDGRARRRVVELRFSVVVEDV